MTTEEKKIIENNFDRMREVIRETKLFINVGDTTVGETYLRDGDVFRIATAIINEGFRLERKGEWIERIEKPSWLEDDVEVYYECSCCGAHSPGESSYCPNCGAKMIGLLMTKCEACGCYIITADDMKMLRDTNYGHADPVGEPGADGVDGELPHWIKIPTDQLIEDHDRVCWECSVCGKETDLPNYEKANFCFNCGARMLKE